MSDKPKNPMTQEDKARIMAAEAKKNDGNVEKGSFGARAQAAADKNAQQKNWVEMNES